jgi:hypothetical protein
LDVETAQAQLDYAKSGEKYRAAKLAYREDSKKKAAFVKARTAHVKATNNWRENYRIAPDGEGDASVSPETLTVPIGTGS